MKRDIDFHLVEDHQQAIHARLENWGRWCNGTSKPSTSPMFRMYRGTARGRGDYGALTVSPVDSADAARIAKAVAHLPEKHRAAIQWCYVKPVAPIRASKSIGTSLDGLYQYLRDGRQMLINRGA